MKWDFGEIKRLVHHDQFGIQPTLGWKGGPWSPVHKIRWFWGKVKVTVLLSKKNNPPVPSSHWVLLWWSCMSPWLPEHHPLKLLVYNISHNIHLAQLILCFSVSWVMTHNISSPTHVVVPSLQLVRQITYLTMECFKVCWSNQEVWLVWKEFIDPRKLQSTWPVVYSAFVSKEEEDRVFTLEEKSSQFLYYKTIAKELHHIVLDPGLPSSGSTMNPAMTCPAQIWNRSHPCWIL